MTEDDVERLEPAPEVPVSPQDAPRGKRQRAADLFSPHRYREMQLKAFERRSTHAPAQERAIPLDDEAIDPPLYSDAPAAEAARAHARGLERHDPLSRLTPVDAPEPADFPFPYDENGDEEDSDATPVEEEYYRSTYETSPAAAHWRSDDVSSPVASSGELYVGGLEEDGGEIAGSDPSEEPRRKQGRNMPVATIVGVILLAATVGASAWHPIAFAVLLYGFAVGAVIEWKRALERHGRRIPLAPVVAATLGLGVATNYGNAEGLVVALLVGCAGVVAWRIGDERIENTLADALAGVLTLLWIPFLASFLFLLELADDGWMRVVVVVLAVVGNDTGALIAGVLFGRHKLLERVSPAKTWEGAIGGLLIGTAAASVAAFFFFDGEWYIGSAVGAACAIAAVIGDLAESALKRDIQVKDMSTALPGHGGILDRIDSLLFAAPVGYVVFAIFLGTLGGGGL